jgi:type IV secretory pathway protease TraF
VLTRYANPRRGDLVVAWAPPAARRLAGERGYLPAGVPLVKSVAATAGDRVCAVREGIVINGRLAALRRTQDPGHRPMPWWSGCRVLGRGELFLLSPAGSLAFDGRYFGITGRNEIIAKATPLWLR